MDLPEVKCKSFRSNLYHEKKVSEIVSKFLNQLDLRKSLKEVRKLGFDKEIQELPEKTLKITKLIHHSRKKLSLQQELLEENLKNDSKNATTQINKELKTIEKNSDLTVEDNKEKKMSEYDNLRWPVLFVYLVNNKASLCLIMNKLSLHKHGYRKYISWGPIKESLISGCLFESNFIERSRRFIIFKKLK